MRNKKAVEPWNQPNEYGEVPGDICCQRAASPRCYEHDPANYPMPGSAHFPDPMKKKDE